MGGTAKGNCRHAQARSSRLAVDSGCFRIDCNFGLGGPIWIRAFQARPTDILEPRAFPMLAGSATGRCGAWDTDEVCLSDEVDIRRAQTYRSKRSFGVSAKLRRVDP